MNWRVYMNSMISTDNELARYLASYLKEREDDFIEYMWDPLNEEKLYLTIKEFYDNLP